MKCYTLCMHEIAFLFYLFYHYSLLYYLLHFSINYSYFSFPIHSLLFFYFFLFFTNFVVYDSIAVIRNLIIKCFQSSQSIFSSYSIYCTLLSFLNSAFNLMMSVIEDSLDYLLCLSLNYYYSCNNYLSF